MAKAKKKYVDPAKRIQARWMNHDDYGTIKEAVAVLQEHSEPGVMVSLPLFVATSATEKAKEILAKYAKKKNKK